ncbi:hypothetical protein F5888DRAFT_1726370 [Russula emetica]|nr:hypothetical protein F5888DRAFT_1726370 [Russula emetica]
MGALKGRFQCLQGLCLTLVIFLHNPVIEMKGEKSVAQFIDIHAIEEDEDTGIHANNQYEVIPEGEAKCEMSIDHRCLDGMEDYAERTEN